MPIIRKSGCCSGWKDQIKQLWENYQNIVKGIKFGDNDVSYPDGDGIVSVDTDGLITVDDALSSSSENPVQNKVIKAKVDSIEADIGTLDGRIDQAEENIDTLEGNISDAEIDISTLQSNMTTMSGRILTLENVQAETRSIAQGSASTVAGYNDRLTDVEQLSANDSARITANEGDISALDGRVDTLESGKVDKLTTSNLQAYTHNGSTQGEVAIVNGTTANTLIVRDANGRAQSADPANGATDKSLVTANWVSQTGDSSPNNLIHRTGNETKSGILTLTDKCVSFGNKYKIGNATPSTSGKWGKMAQCTVTDRFTRFFAVGTNNNSEGGCWIFWVSTRRSGYTPLVKSERLIQNSADWNKPKFCVTLDSDGVVTIWGQGRTNIGYRLFVESNFAFNEIVALAWTTPEDTTQYDNKPTTDDYAYVVDLVE